MNSDLTNGADGSSLAARAVREYRILKKLLRLIRAEINGESSPVDHSPTAKELNTLLTHLEHHFKLEEAGGLFKDLQLKLPGEIERIERLRADHPALLDELRRLIANLERESGPPDSAALRDEVENFLRDLETHEIAENNLFQRAYNLDEAAHD